MDEFVAPIDESPLPSAADFEESSRSRRRPAKKRCEEPPRKVVPILDPSALVLANDLAPLKRAVVRNFLLGSRDPKEAVMAALNSDPNGFGLRPFFETGKIV